MQENLNGKTQIETTMFYYMNNQNQWYLAKFQLTAVRPCWFKNWPVCRQKLKPNQNPNKQNFEVSCTFPES